MQGAAAKCCFRVLLFEWCVRCGAGLPVPPAGCRCMVSLLDAAAECFFRVLLSECRVRFGAGLLVPLQGARVQGTRATKKNFCYLGSMLAYFPKECVHTEGFLR